jgi:hypothetical protein
MTAAKDVRDAIKTIETVHLRRALDVMAARIEEVDLFARTMAAAALLEDVPQSKEAP